MDDFTLRIQPSSKHLKNYGEVSYLIAPVKEYSSPEVSFERSRYRSLEKKFLAIRKKTVSIIDHLTVEHFSVPPVGSLEPIKWYLAETTRYFEEHLLRYFEWETTADSQLHAYCTLDEILQFRRALDETMCSLFDSNEFSRDPEATYRTYYGLQLELKMQEQILCVIKSVFFSQGIQAGYAEMEQSSGKPSEWQLHPINWIDVDGDLQAVGYDGNEFSFPDELPYHMEYIYAYRMAHRLITNGEYLQFIKDGGYRNKKLWEDEGWQWVERNRIEHPKYWNGEEEYTLKGFREIDPHIAISHVNYHEAIAFANWTGARLPTESEWEVSARTHNGKEGNFFESGIMHPTALRKKREEVSNSVFQLAGDVWEWTTSSYLSYPRYSNKDEYIPVVFNSHARVVRGSSCLSSVKSYRRSSRLPLSPFERDYCTGIRLVRESL